MSNKKQKNGKSSVVNVVLAITSATLLFGCSKPNEDKNDLRNFKQVNLVANLSKYHPVTVDPTLINGFGLAWSPTGTAWVNSVGGHVSELYSAEGAIARTPVNIPAPADTIGGLPCGVVFSGGKNFNLSNGPSAFLFAGFDGVLSGWNPASGNNAKRLKNPAHAVYTGLAMGVNNGHNLVYAANFGAGKIDVWDSLFAPVTMSFKDAALPAGYSPYNIQNVGDLLFVMYARLGADGHFVTGNGEGYVSVFNTDGSLVSRFASKGTLNVPWGVVMAPHSFLEDDDKNFNAPANGKLDEPDGGTSSNDAAKKDPVILIGNFGDGRINVFSLAGKYLGQLQSHNHPIVIDGLWALSFAPSTSTINPGRLFFTAGPEHETDGLFGYLIKE
jgi:uncharacterized protein (TIGR03118 family)